MNNNISKIKNNIQDRNSIAWKKLCEYVDEVAENGTDEFEDLPVLKTYPFSDSSKLHNFSFFIGSRPNENSL